MTFGESIKTVYSKYATFSGRASRSEFWWFQLFIFLVGLVTSLNEIVDAVWSLGNLLPSLAVACRRLHDTDRSGWWQILPLAGVALIVLGFSAEVMLYLGIVVTIGLVILLIVWYATKGTEGPNRFGDDPFGRMDVEIFD